jgi:hypothetical protein
MTPTRTLVAAAAFAAAAALAPSTVDARGGAGHVASAGGWHGGSGHWRGGHWGHRGPWRGAFWGGVGFGLGFGTIGYWGPYAYYPAYVGPGWGTVVYDAPLVAAPVYGVEPTRIGQAVPQVAPPAPEPIFYPRNGQSAETTENDRRDCNRWATTQRGAMADATIFQRATLACMEGRGYTVK